MIAPDLVDVIANVQQQIGEQLDLLDRESGRYVRDCAETTLRPARIQGPKAPAGMHPKLREMIRELVSDELYVHRHQRARSAA